MDNLQAEGWELVKSIQSMWIGHCDGCFIDFTFEVTLLNNYLIDFFKYLYSFKASGIRPKINSVRIYTKSARNLRCLAYRRD